MGSIQKFLFEQSFDDGRSPLRPQEPEPDDLPPPEPEPPPEPTFTLSEVRQQLAEAEAAAHAQGFAEGRVQGRQEAETADQRALAVALEGAAVALADTLAALRAAHGDRQQGAAALALAIVRKLFPLYLRRHGEAEVEATVAHFLTELLEEPKLVLRVHPDRLDGLRDRIADMAARSGFAGTVSMLGDPRLGPLDVRADWGDGGAERDVTAIWREVERIAGGLPGTLPGGPDEASPAPLAAVL